MKALFVGPSLPDAKAFCGPDIDVRPPAAHGDVVAAVREGARVIGIVDGNFEHVAPVWHKEILYALEQGVAMFGAASMGALRAAECAAFGMIGIGRIYDDYASGRRIDDADVALLHGPAQLGYPALSLPVVNVDATLDGLTADDTLDDGTAARLRQASATLFYKHRTWRRILDVTGDVTGHDTLAQLLPARTINQKREDSIRLIERMRNFVPQSPVKQGSWTLRTTTLWRMAFKQPVT